ncbi:ferritin-like domain-containing protein [Ferruginibacter sp. SUN106]|uniref:ferritin-like domain-containing protein n=1 Tax=Ferruginibacter sp. SUN106 TaxID=2978348 RepID=UPI003D3613D2
MKTSQEWITYFNTNLQEKRIDWSQAPAITKEELKAVLKSLQAWQLGETSEGKNLIKASEKYAAKHGDVLYVDAIKLFIKEEQKHGNNLGRYLDAIGQARIKKNWGDTLFRKIRYLNASMEMWTIAVITVESAAQIFYQALKDATQCSLLKEICTDILIDEAPHIKFQQERLARIFNAKTMAGMAISYYGYKFFYKVTSLVVWLAHKKLFKAGGIDFKKYYKKMNMKLEKTVGRLKYGTNENEFVPSYRPTI